MQECTTNDRSDGTGTKKAPERSFGAQEHPPTATRRPSVSQICDDRFTHVGGQRQLKSSSPFTADIQRSILPVDVIKLEKHHFAGAQAQPRKQEQDGIVASPNRSAAVN